MDEAAATISNCARCGDPATLVCTGCKAEDPAPGELVAKTKYCSVTCQKDDWPRHRAFCKAARAIGKYRSSILQGGKVQPPKPQRSELQSDEVGPLKIQSGQPAPLETLPDNSAHSCAKCQSPATNACKGCKAAPNFTDGLVSTIYYCSPTCQRANWSEHKKACLAAQARRKLYEAGQGLQKRYYWYCRAMVMVMVETNTLDGDYEIMYEKDSVPRTVNATALLQEMRPHSEEEQAYMACVIGSVHTGAMVGSVKEYLQGKQRPEVTISLGQISHTSIRPSDRYPRSQRLHENSPPPLHPRRPGIHKR